MDKDLIKRNFSLQAKHYDQYSALQKNIAAKLIEKIPSKKYLNILELASGTGNYTEILLKRFPFSQITALDISPEMTAIAKSKLESPPSPYPLPTEKRRQNKNIYFITADAENMFFQEKFDLITSNASMQWFDNIALALSNYQKLLTNEGVLAFSTFGPLTFQELNVVLKKYTGEDVYLSASSFLAKNDLDDILGKLFKKIDFTEEIILKEYDSLLELLRKIKYSGTRGEGVRNVFWTPKTIAKLEKIYQEIYGGVRASYQIFYYFSSEAPARS